MVINAYYQRPNVNYVPPNQRAGRWGEVSRIKAPFQDAASAESNTFGYWFNYLWEEARQAEKLSLGDKARLSEAFLSVLDVAPGDKATLKKDPADDTKVVLDGMTDEKKRQVLTTLLVIGFKRVALSGYAPAPGSFVEVPRVVDATQVFVQKMQYGSPADNRTMHLGFRADGRNYQTLVNQTGMLARARSHGQDVQKWYGLNEKWNPLSLGVYADSLFLRKGTNKDNCLHTVVSVGMEFAELLPYPLLSDKSLFRWANTPLTSWTQQDEAQALGHKYRVRAVREVPNGPIDHLESEISIYVLNMNASKAFSTKAWQAQVGVTNPFPEAAVDQIPAENILAEVEITRKHFFDNGDLTFYDFELRAKRLLPSEDILKVRFGDAFPGVLKAKLDQLARSAKTTWRVANERYERLKLQSRPQAQAANAGPIVCPTCGRSFRTQTLFNNVLNHPCAKAA